MPTMEFLLNNCEFNMRTKVSLLVVDDHDCRTYSEFNIQTMASGLVIIVQLTVSLTCRR